MRDPDPHRGPNSHFRRPQLPILARPRTPQFSEPQRSARKKIKSIESSIDSERRREPPRPAREITKLFTLPMSPHQLNSFQWLERSNQNASAHSRPFARNVQHEVHAVIEIHIHVPVPQEQRPVPLRLSAKVMPRGITRRITLRFDDSPAQPALLQFVHDDLPDQKSRKFQRVAGKLLVRDSADFKKRAFHGLRSNCIRRLVVE